MIIHFHKGATLPPDASGPYPQLILSQGPVGYWRPTGPITKQSPGGHPWDAIPDLSSLGRDMDWYSQDAYRSEMLYANEVLNMGPLPAGIPEMQWYDNVRLAPDGNWQTNAGPPQAVVPRDPGGPWMSPAMSASFWYMPVNPLTTGSTSHSIGWWDETSDHDWSMLFGKTTSGATTTNRMGIRFRAWNYNTITSISPLADRHWHHIAWTADETGLLTFYINGSNWSVQMSPADWSRLHSSENPNQHVWMRNRSARYAEHAFFNRALSPAEVIAQYEVGTGIV